MMNSASSAFCGVGLRELNVAVLTHGFVRGHKERVAQLMGDDDRRHAFEIAQLDHFFVNGHRGDRVQPGGRFVVEQNPRLGGHRTGDRDAAPLSTRQLRRHPVHVLLEPDEPEHFLHAPIRLLFGHAALFVQLVADVLLDAQRVEQRTLLEHHADVGSHLHDVLLAHRVHPFAVHEDRAAIRLQQSQYELQDGGLA